MTAIDDWRELARVRRAVVLLDLVESVRLMQAHEGEVISRWLRFVAAARQKCLPAHGGVLVKSLGDGMLMSFEDVPSAVQCARALADEMRRQNDAAAGPVRLELRMGMHVADVVVDAFDIYGSGVNLAARLAALGRPGDIVMSSEARDQLVHGLDAEVEDLGDCFVKHLDAPIRAWRWVPPAAAGPRVVDVDGDRIPTVAVVPSHPGEGADSPPARAAAVIADELAALVAGCSGLSIIARPTVAALAQRRADRAQMFSHLRIRYLVEARCVLRGDDLHCSIALFGVADTEPLLQFEISERVDDTRGHASDNLHAAATAIVRTIADGSLSGARDRHLPTIGSYSLLLGAIADMHRMSRTDSERARLELDELLVRHPRAPEPHAWLAKWHMLRVAQRWSTDQASEADRADFHVRRALDVNPGHALALAMQGQMQLYQRGHLDTAEGVLLRAVEQGPSEPLAWLFLSNLRAHQGHGDAAIAAARRAMKLSPLDPTRFLFDMFAAQACLCAGAYADARDHARASLRGNRMHLPTYPPLIIASALLGDLEGARATARDYLAMSPAASAREYARRFRGPEAQGTLFADALRDAGIPA